MPSICAAIPLFINYFKGHSTWLHVGTLNLQARKAKIIGDVTSIPGWHRGNKYGLAIQLKTDEFPQETPHFLYRNNRRDPLSAGTSTS